MSKIFWVTTTLFFHFLSYASLPQSFDPNISEELRMRDGMPNLFKKTNNKSNITIGFIGGSITRQTGWSDNVFTWFQNQYKDISFTEINAAVPGTGADFAASRVKDNLLIHKPDVVFIEYRVNGGGGYEARAIEGLIRQIWETDPNIDICFVYTVGEWMLDRLMNGKQYGFGIIIEEMANKYGIPSIDFGVEVVKQLKANQLVFKNSNPVEGKVVFSKDGVHPNTDGHKIYSDIAIRSILSMHEIGESGPHTIPNPIVYNHFSNSSLLSVHNVIKSSGWQSVDINTDAVYISDRYRTNSMLSDALKCSKVNETLTFNWEGDLICFTTIPQGKGMEVEIIIDNGAPETFTFEQSSGNVYFSKFFYAKQQEVGQHTAKLKVTKLPDGTSIYIGQAMVHNLPSESNIEDKQKPFKEVHTIPGRIEAEDFDTGGEGIAFHEVNTNKKSETNYRSEQDLDVEIETKPNQSNGHIISWTRDNEWLEYTIQVKNTGEYMIKAMATARNDAMEQKGLHLFLDGKALTDKISVTPSDDWFSDWAEYSVNTKLEAGEHVLRVKFFTTSRWCINLDYLEFIAKP
ncbi:carbohydrate-binding protein [Aquimarina algiphila]|uniref:carbohydrate-binding protein n=1 Tax=Aquimarina algiphila TaxID=2047982 RepID=UPI0024930406|nr:carbohydrate-binding protein [Aquimarina algiphila]